MPSPLPPHRAALLEQAQTLCREHGATLLFLTLFGSTLYGTETPGKSDVDVRGIFLPSPDRLLLNCTVQSLHFSTGNNERRNTAGDVDIDLWSIQHWLLKLLPAGDMGALDLLFAPSHAACTLYRSPLLDQVFAAPLRFVDTARNRAYAEYSVGQAKKYGIKGSRIGALKTVRNWLREHCPAPGPDDRLRHCLDDLVAACADGRFCAPAMVQEEKALQLCGKQHVGSIRLTEFTRRVEADMQRYGARAEEAERNQGLDFKALSHALRALSQMKELLQTGQIIFPLREREELVAVKQGRYSWAELEPLILSRLEEVDVLRNNARPLGHYEAAFAEQCVLACYGRTALPAFFPSPARPTGHFSIPDLTWTAIQRKLEQAEQTHPIKIVYACESGSRGWGFASEDSDFDVRFVYVHQPEWYLGIAPEEKRDVLDLGIDMTPAGELDVNGWELRKALKLFRQSNPPLLEWLSSPIVYHEEGPAASLLRNAAPVCVSPLRIWHHYRSIMEKSLVRYHHKKSSIKTWFSIIRPLLAMHWLEQSKGVPPMRFDQLVEGAVSDAAIRAELQALVEVKRQVAEHYAFIPPPLTTAFVDAALRRLAAGGPHLPQAQGRADLDHIFRTVLAAAWPNTSLFLPFSNRDIS